MNFVQAISIITKQGSSIILHMRMSNLKFLSDLEVCKFYRVSEVLNILFLCMIRSGGLMPK